MKSEECSSPLEKFEDPKLQALLDENNALTQTNGKSNKCLLIYYLCMFKWYEKNLNT